MSENNDTPIFNIEKIYTKDISLETPGSPECFFTTKELQPELNIKVNHSNSKLENNTYSCFLTLTITAKVNNDKILFLCEIIESGIFRIENLSEDDINAVLNINCPEIILPYAREFASNLIVRAGFPPVYISHINFAAMYEQKLQQQQGK